MLKIIQAAVQLKGPLVEKDGIERERAQIVAAPGV
jgi:hypothetical protein